MISYSFVVILNTVIFEDCFYMHTNTHTLRYILFHHIFKHFYLLVLKKLIKNPGKYLQVIFILIKVTTTTKFPENNCLILWEKLKL